MRQPEALGDARGDRDRPVDAGRNQSVDALGAGQALDARFVLGRDDRATVGVAEAGRRRIPVERDHVELTCAGSGEQPELGRSRAED